MAVSQAVIDEIQNHLDDLYYDKVNQMNTGNEEEREEATFLLDKIIDEEYKDKINTEDLHFVKQEIIGLGIIDRIVENDDEATDIGCDGDQFIVNKDSGFYKVDDPLINHDYVDRLISRISTRVNKDFTKNEPIVGAQINNLRIHSIHSANSTSGSVISVRISKDDMVIDDKSFKINGFAHPNVAPLMKYSMLGYCNQLIGGGMGFGKTSLQKYTLGSARPGEKIFMIQDTAEVNVKKNYPHLYIYSMVANKRLSYEDLVIESLRHNAVWVMPAEVRGREIVSLVDGVVDGVKVLTTLHTYDARMMLRKIVLTMMKYSRVNEEAILRDLYYCFQLGYQLKRYVLDGRVHRYLGEIVEFRPNLDCNTIYKAKRSGHNFDYSFGSLSQEMHDIYAEVETCDMAWLKEVYGFAE